MLDKGDNYGILVTEKGRRLLESQPMPKLMAG